MPKLYISFAADLMDERLEIASYSPEDTRKLSQAIDHGNDFWRSWAINTGGSVIMFAGPKGKVQINADHIEELREIQEKYMSAIEGNVSVGVGLSLLEADKALKAAQDPPKGEIVFYTPELEQEDEEQESIVPMAKAEAHPMQGHFENIINENKELENQKQTAQAQQEKTSQTKMAVVQILQQIKANAKELESLKESQPHLYESIMSMAQTLIMLARSIGPNQAQVMAKAEGPPGPHVKHFVMTYPVGFMLPPGPGTANKHGGKVKVATVDGRTKWHSVRSGMIMGPDGGIVSSRNPSGTTQRQG